MELRDRLLECIKHYYEDYFCFDAVYYKWCARYDIKDTTLFILERIYTAPERCTQKYLCETLSYPEQNDLRLAQAAGGAGVHHPPEGSGGLSRQPDRFHAGRTGVCRRSHRGNAQDRAARL